MGVITLCLERPGADSRVEAPELVSSKAKGMSTKLNLQFSFAGAKLLFAGAKEYYKLCHIKWSIP